MIEDNALNSTKMKNEICNENGFNHLLVLLTLLAELYRM
jgi:hypothetical protein